MTVRFVSSVIDFTCAGVSSTSNMIFSAPTCFAVSIASCSFPFPIRYLGSVTFLICMIVPSTALFADLASDFSSSSDSSASERYFVEKPTSSTPSRSFAPPCS